MTWLSLALWVAGVVAIVVAVFRAQDPWRRLSDLDRLADNARRYDSWRGTRTTAPAGDTTGADIMRHLLRRRLMVWGALAIVGAVLIVAGFAIR
jgi:hypothetical protein